MLATGYWLAVFVVVVVAVHFLALSSVLLRLPFRCRTLHRFKAHIPSQPSAQRCVLLFARACACQVAMGFIKVANETMCRPIRALTQMKVCGGDYMFGPEVGATDVSWRRGPRCGPEV